MLRGLRGEDLLRRLLRRRLLRGRGEGRREVGVLEVAGAHAVPGRAREGRRRDAVAVQSLLQRKEGGRGFKRTVVRLIPFLYQPAR